MRYLLLTAILGLSLNCPAQKNKLKKTPDAITVRGYSFHALKFGSDSIRFVLHGEKKDSAKGLVLFIQGSTPVPLFVSMKDGIAPPLPFDPKPFEKDYYFAVVSKPGIPLLTAAVDEMNMYLDPETGQIPSEFVKDDRLIWYSEACDSVLKFLCRQPWTNKNKVVVVGHSQGARTAADLCTRNTDVDHLVFMSCSAFSLSYTFLHDIRNSSPDSIQNYVADDMLKQLEPELAPGTEKSFYNSDPIEDLVKLNIPVHVVYGTSDRNTPFESNEQIRLRFMRAGKKNLFMKVYPGYDHNYFEKPEKGSPVFHWDDVVKEIFGELN